jgi:hypothetical protein
MAKWRKKESLGSALAREGRGIAKGVFKELLSNLDFGTVQAQITFPAGRSPKREVVETAASFLRT